MLGQEVLLWISGKSFWYKFCISLLRLYVDKNIRHRADNRKPCARTTVRCENSEWKKKVRMKVTLIGVFLSTASVTTHLFFEMFITTYMKHLVPCVFIENNILVFWMYECSLAENKCCLLITCFLSQFSNSDIWCSKERLWIISFQFLVMIVFLWY